MAVVSWPPRMKSFIWGRAAVEKVGLVLGVVFWGMEDWNSVWARSMTALLFLGFGEVVVVVVVEGVVGNFVDGEDGG